MSKLTLFTNTYPYGTGETFLHEELPFLAAKFSRVVIFPLYIPGGTNNSSSNIKREIPDNVEVKKPLLPFDHKDKTGLIFHGSIPRTPINSTTEFIKKTIFLSWNKMWIYCNYTLLLNSILSNNKIMQEVENEISSSNIVYFYWGDKSALIIPYLKKRLPNPPPFVVRFHGSDLYEEAKGYLPYREELYKSIDYAVPISNNGGEYIREKYAKSLPKNIVVHKLGSYSHAMPAEIEPNGIFHIISCSNVIELKRVELIAKALLKIENDIRFIERMAENGYKKIKWTHIGDGPLLPGIKKLFEVGTSIIVTDFKGRMPHEDVLKFYSEHRTELFVQVSRSEGIPVSIMEALSFGIPVAATNVGGVSELFSTNILSPEENTTTTSPECEYGTLLPKELTVEELQKTIMKYILLPDNTISKARAAARIEWETNWDSKQNYTAFAEFMGTAYLDF